MSDKSAALSRARTYARRPHTRAPAIVGAALPAGVSFAFRRPGNPHSSPVTSWRSLTVIVARHCPRKRSRRRALARAPTPVSRLVFARGCRSPRWMWHSAVFVSPRAQKPGGKAPLLALPPFWGERNFAVCGRWKLLLFKEESGGRDSFRIPRLHCFSLFEILLSGVWMRLLRRAGKFYRASWREETGAR